MEDAMSRIVVGVDGSDNSIDALRWALDEAQRRHATLQAVAAWQFPYTGIGFAPSIGPAGLEDGAAAILEQALRLACPDDAARPPIEQLVVQDTPAHALVEAAKGADLLVVGSRGRGGFKGLLLGSVSTQVVHHAPCPIVVVPHTRADQP
jgi:nucleotide-binding universal stress UspA family protein